MLSYNSKGKYVNGGIIMKRVTLSILVMFLSLFLVTPTFASDVSEKADQELETLTKNKGEVIYQDDEITVESFGNDTEISDAIFNHPDSVVEDDSVEVNEDEIMPRSSVNGPGGRASIVAGNSGSVVYWSVKPKMSWPYGFLCIVKLRYHSGFKRDAAVGGSGVAGSTSSGKVTMNKNNGGVAYLSGSAYSLNGNLFKVLPGVHVSFRPN